MRKPFLLTCLTALLTVACGQPQSGECASGAVTASNAWVRAADEGRPMSAGYVSLCNGLEEADRLVSATFENASATELHATSVSEDGVASMNAIEGLDLPVGESVSLAPGGAHIMLIGLAGPLAKGDDAAITLEFENAPAQTILFEVRGMNNEPGHAGH